MNQPKNCEHEHEHMLDVAASTERAIDALEYSLVNFCKYVDDSQLCTCIARWRELVDTTTGRQNSRMNVKIPIEKIAWWLCVGLDSLDHHARKTKLEGYEHVYHGNYRPDSAAHLRIKSTNSSIMFSVISHSQSDSHDAKSSRKKD